MTSIYLVRHGQASFGAENYDALSPTGIRQAELLAEHLTALDERFDAVYTGPLARQKDTAQAITDAYRRGGREVPLIERSAFEEFDYRPVLAQYLQHANERHPERPYDWATLMRDRKLFQHFYAEALTHWVRGEADEVLEVGQTWEHFHQRCYQGLREVIEANGKGKRVVISTSGGVISALLKHTLELPDEKAVRIGWTVANTSITRLFSRGGEISMASFNALPHLERPEHKDLITFR